jgi:hypothetical protein
MSLLSPDGSEDFLFLLDTTIETFEERTAQYIKDRELEPELGTVLALNGSTVTVQLSSGTLEVNKQGGAVAIGDVVAVDVDLNTIQGAAGILS